MHRVLLGTSRKCGRNIKTRCIGSTSNLFKRKVFCSIKHDRTQSSFTTRSQHRYWSSFRRMVGKTLAHQFGAVVEQVCAPFQLALSQGRHGLCGSCNPRDDRRGCTCHSSVSGRSWSLRPRFAQLHTGEADGSASVATLDPVRQEHVRPTHQLRVGRAARHTTPGVAT